MELYPAEGPCEGFEPVWTCQGILRFPKRILIASISVPEGECEEEAWEDEEQRRRWEVPDYNSWLSVPGFPEFLEDPTKLSPAVIRPMTPEERRAYYSSGKPSGLSAAESPILVFLAGSPCVRIGGKVVRLSKRGHELLIRTVERGSLPHEAAILALEKLPTESPSGSTVVEFDALRDYRRAIVDKVRDEAGVPCATLLDVAFRSEKRVFVYDEAILPTRTE